MERPKRFSVPLTLATCTDTTSIFRSLVLNISSTAALISGLVASDVTRNAYWLFFSPMNVLFSDTTGASSTFIRRSGFLVPVAALLISAAPRIWPSRFWSAARWHDESGSPDPHARPRRYSRWADCALKAADSH